MRVLILSLFCASLLLTSNVFALSKYSVADCFQAVAASKQVSSVAKSGAQLKTIDRVATYRCIGCYGFDVTFETYDHASGETTTSTKTLKTIIEDNKIVVKSE